MVQWDVKGHRFIPSGVLFAKCEVCTLEVSVLAISWGTRRTVLPCPGAVGLIIEPVAETRCECGSYKALNIGKGKSGHSDWCPWRQV